MRGGPDIATIERPTRDIFDQQLALVESWATRREERMTEIVSQVVPQIPHWISICNLHPQRTPKTIELIETALKLAVLVVMRFKQALACPRPIEYSPNLQPILLTPGYSALPSGHATESHLVARLLRELLDQPSICPLAEQLDALAARITENRVIAGLHFPIDGAAGRMLGDTLAGFFTALCRHRPAIEDDQPVPTSATWMHRTFLRSGRDGASDWDPKEPLDRPQSAGAPIWSERVQTAAQPAPLAPMLNWLWREARKEQRRAGFLV